MRVSRCATASVALAAALLLGACGPSGDTAAHAPVSPPGTAVAAPATTPEATTASATGPSLVVVDCSGTNVLFIDPASGQERSANAFLVPDGSSAHLDCGPDPTSASVRQPHGDILSQFNKDFTKLVVSTPNAQGGSDVGYVDLSDKLTDVTAEQGATGDFEDVPQDRGASFQPGTDELWFVRDGKAVSVTTGEDETHLKRHPAIKVSGYVSVDATGTYFWPTFVPISPDGRAWVGVLENDEGVEALPCVKSRTCNGSGMGYGIYPPGGIDSGNFDIKKPRALYAFADYQGVCSAWAWISTTSWLCSDGGFIGVVSVGANHTLTVASPIPETSGRVDFDPVLSPDRTQIAFQSCRADDCDFYTVPVNGSAQPVKVGPSQGSSDALVAWTS